VAWRSCRSCVVGRTWNSKSVVDSTAKVFERLSSLIGARTHVVEARRMKPAEDKPRLTAVKCSGGELARLTTITLGGRILVLKVVVQKHNVLEPCFVK